MYYFPFYTSFCTFHYLYVCIAGSPFFPLGCKTCHADGVVYHPLGNCTMFGRADKSLRRPALGPCEEAAKKFLLESYTFENHVQELNTEKDKKLRWEVDIYANRALEAYMDNSGHEHGYKIVEHIACVRFGCDVPSITYFADRWAHLFFEAMITDPTCTDSSPKLSLRKYALICTKSLNASLCHPLILVLHFLELKVVGKFVVNIAICFILAILVLLVIMEPLLGMPWLMDGHGEEKLCCARM